MFRRVKSKVLRYILIVVYTIIILICAFQINFLYLFGYSPSKKDIVMPHLNIASELYTADSVLIGRYYREDRDPVVFDSISKHVIDALIATEDIRFYKHNGVDIIGVFSSVFSTMQGDRRGGSTITQQLAKNLYQTRYQKSQGLLGRVPGVGILVTKFKEWMTAFKLEQKYAKQEILTMYLNTVSFSNNAYGINSASIRYFNKNAIDLNAGQASVLIGMLKGTTYYNPVRNPENAIKRRNIVLGQMGKAGFLSSEEVAQATQDSLILDLNNSQEAKSNDSYLRAAVERWLEDWSEENNIDIYTAGLKIYTTINSKMQQLAENEMSAQMEVLQNRLDNTWAGQIPWRDKAGNVIEGFMESHVRKLPVYKSLMRNLNNEDSVFRVLNEPKPMKIFTWEGNKDVEYSTMDSLKHYLTMLNTGVLSLDPHNGDIKIWIGGINYRYYKYDHVDQAKRQAGSTFKPFVYLTALESGMSPCDKVTDRPVTIKFVNDKGEDEVWQPKNADWSVSYADMSLRWAMARSLNTVTAQLTEKVGWDSVVKTAHRVGIDSHLESVPSVGLGSNDVSLYEMVRSYAVFINGGNKIEPRLVTKILDQDDKIIAEFTPKKEAVVDKENAWLMGYMLKGTIEEPGGTSQALWEWDLFRNGNEIGGKTGTSSDYVDGWYIGVTKDLVTGVWVGCDEQSVRFKSSQTGEGSKTALPIFGKIMEALYADPDMGYTFGKFPEPTVEIHKKYSCPTPRPILSESQDSLVISIDSLPKPKLVLPEVMIQQKEEKRDSL